MYSLESSEEPLFTGTRLTLTLGYPRKLLIGVYLDNFVEVVDDE